MDRPAPAFTQADLTPAARLLRPFSTRGSHAGSALRAGIALAAAPCLALIAPAARVMAAPATATEAVAAAAVAAAPAAATPPAGRPTPASSPRPTSAAPGAAAAAPPSVEEAGPSWGLPGWMRASDQRFILMMIPHHDGAIAMADLALTRARHPELRALARRIADTQRRENALMRQWYRQWFGTEVPTLEAGRLRPGSGSGAGLGMGPGMGMGAGMGMGLALQGMETSLAALRAAPDFDRVFIEQMIPHHRMGVMMAAHALQGTDHRELRVLQQTMVRVQSQEIERMAAWYRRWTGG